MTLKPIVAALTLVGASTANVADGGAQDPRESILVSVDWLAQHYQDDNIVLLQVGRDSSYQAEHIPGAHFVGMMDMSHPGSHSSESLVLELPEPEALQEVLRRWGVNEDSRIVVYWSNEWVTPTARAVFTLDWAGLGDRTVLLDGGIGAWKAAGHPVTAASSTEGGGNVVVRPRDELVVDADWVQENATQPGFALIDARARVVFDGIREDRGKAGHIPGAGSTPWAEFITEEVTFKSPAEIRAVFEAAGVKEGDTVVAYCHIGQYATAALFAARTLGHEVKLYDGAFQDWAARDLPVER